MIARCSNQGPLLAAITLVLAACGAPTPLGNDPVPIPVLFAPGTISTEAREYGITFGPDLNEAYFTRRARGRRTRAQIYVSYFVDGAWTAAKPAFFSMPTDESPFLSRDGNKLIYSSRRDVPGWSAVRGDSNLWIVERTEEGWSVPKPLAGDVNRPSPETEGPSTQSEFGPVILADGTLLYATNEDDEWGTDIYVADELEGTYLNPRPMQLNTGGAEMSPTSSPDGQFLLFQGKREVHAFGEDEIYAVAKTEYGWGEPRLLPSPINSPYNDGYPSFSPDGRFFFFASDRYAESGYYSIYYVETAALGLGIQPN